EAGVMGALTGVVGSLQALEVIKEITGAGTSLAGKLLIYDALETRFRTVKLKWDPKNPLTGETPSIKDLSIHSV
ncbi:MAG TPA: adenylyltransferase, partial [Rhodobiaceae bacterium]|nr:adenylyltransferase [Rhodobiaceae bacterium]